MVARVRIDGSGVRGYTKIYLNDTDISMYVGKVQIEINAAAEVPQLHFTCLTTDIEWTGEFVGDATIFFEPTTVYGKFKRQLRVTWVRVEKWLKQLKS